MTKINEIYKCEICGNIVSVDFSGNGTLVCCEKPMILQEPKIKEQEGNEKHVPIIEIEGNNVTVKVGSVEHPMTAEHYINLIQLIKDNKIIAEKHLIPGEKPEAVFCIDDTSEIKAREYCTVHGLWTN